MIFTVARGGVQAKERRLFENPEWRERRRQTHPEDFAGGGGDSNINVPLQDRSWGSGRPHSLSPGRECVRARIQKC